MSDLAAVVFCAIGVLAVCVGGVMLLDSSTCAGRWEKSGMASSWGPLQGCLVQRKDGTWVPDKTLRQFAAD